MEFNEAIEKSIEIIKNENIAILYGAGLSHNSGVFKACDFYDSILGELEINKDIINMVKKRTCQLEDFLMRLVDDFNYINKSEILHYLLSTYTVGEPNTNHFFLAYLMQENLVNTIYTTNFDEHFETAYQETTRMNCDFPQVLYISDGRIKQMNTPPFSVENVNAKKTYFKLHGCVKEIQNVSTFLPRVASEKNVTIINTVIEKMFVNSTIKYVLVMGYSFSDAYDILKALRNIAVSKNNGITKLIVIDDCRNDDKKKCFDTIQEYLIEKEKENNPSNIPEGIEGFVIRDNTDEFIKKVWMRIGGYYEKNVDRNNAYTNSINYVKKYIAELKNIYNGYYFYLHSWRFHYEVGQNLFLIKKKLKEKHNSCNRNKIQEEIKLMTCALNKSVQFAEKSYDVIRKDETQFINKILAKKHLLLSKIALSCGNSKEAYIQINELKKLAQEVDRIKATNVDYLWLYSEIMYFSLLWEFEYLIYGVLSEDYCNYISILDEINQVSAQIKNYIYKYNIKLVYYRLLILGSVVRVKINDYEDNLESDFVLAEKELFTEGRVEYLAFLQHGYATFLKSKYEKSKDNDVKNKALQYYDEAIYLYKNLGDKEREEICLSDKENFELLL